jgi:hypothetical protein
MLCAAEMPSISRVLGLRIAFGDSIAGSSTRKGCHATDHILLRVITASRVYSTSRRTDRGDASGMLYNKRLSARLPQEVVRRTRSLHALSHLELCTVLVDATSLAVHLYSLIFQSSERSRKIVLAIFECLQLVAAGLHKVALALC